MIVKACLLMPEASLAVKKNGQGPKLYDLVHYDYAGDPVKAATESSIPS